MENTKGPTVGHGKICYIEIPAVDIARSAAFYSTVFCWSVRKRGDGSTAFDDGVGEVSGTWVTDRKPSTEIGLLVHIMVDDAVATLDKIVANGGKIVDPIGRHAPEITARFSDPDGNVWGIYQERGR
jgi:hypothetical protein